LKPAVVALVAFASTILAVTPAPAQTLEQMAGQMIVVGFSGDDPDDASVERVRDEIAAGILGGIMYLRPNVASLDAVRRMNAAFRAASPNLPPFIALDQEGGSVERLTRAVGFSEVPSAARIAKATSPEQAQEIYSQMAANIAELGFTVNFGPVVDINVNPRNQIIAKFGRAFGATADAVIPYAAAFIKAHHEAGLLTALKHFPGHGSSTADSHEGFVDITQSWDATELEPYRELIGLGLADLVMIGHLYHSDYAGDETQLPSSLSPEWVTGMLRGELGYTGVIISDDLEMGAIRKHFELKETVTRAVRAGVDVLLFTNTAKPRASLAEEVRAILLAEAELDPAFRARIEESYKRIVALKQRIGAGRAELAAQAAPVLEQRPYEPTEETSTR
jgi:beta-N-acetylhexosaminidase